MAGNLTSAGCLSFLQFNPRRPVPQQLNTCSTLNTEEGTTALPKARDRLSQANDPAVPYPGCNQRNNALRYLSRELLYGLIQQPLPE